MELIYENEKSKIYNGDNLELLKTLDDNSINLALVDPPYGIGADKGTAKGFGASKHTNKEYNDNWDNETPSQEVFNEILRVSKNAIIFGGNYFTDKLPVNGHWIVWDKTGGIKFDNPFSDCELLWTNINKKSVKKYTHVQQGFIGSEKDRIHPTQKPLELLTQIIKDYTQPGDIILDCYAGSFTTIVASDGLGRYGIGIDKLKKYCVGGAKRLQTMQTRLDI